MSDNEEPRGEPTGVYKLRPDRRRPSPFVFVALLLGSGLITVALVMPGLSQIQTALLGVVGGGICYAVATID